jgi:hypothetical protein
MLTVPEMTDTLANELTLVSLKQLKTSTDFKRPRFGQIQESEDLYAGIVKKTIAREMSEPFPFMSGFVDHLFAEVDGLPDVEFEHADEADLRVARQVTALFAQEKASQLPFAMWAMKDRWAKKLAIFSGRAVFKYYAESAPAYRSCLSVVDHYDFHCEPAGGGHLENHLFCGEEGIFKTEEEIAEGAKEGYYDPIQVAALIAGSTAAEHKQNEDEQNARLNRSRGLQLDPATNNYTGQGLYKFIEWYTTYKGVRWQLLIDVQSRKWIRAKALREVFRPLPETGEALYPYVTWATHEDPKVFWSKAPCDDARPIAKTVNKVLNQEVYNREKINKGVRLYDPSMIYDVEALADERPDGLIPVDTRNGRRALSTAIYPVEHGEIRGTLELVTFLDAYHGTKAGAPPAAEGNAPNSKKATVFLGELDQAKKRLGVYNTSYKEAWQQIALRHLFGLDDHLDGDIAIQLIGARGIEWDTLSKEGLRRNRPLGIKVLGGDAEARRLEAAAARKAQALGQVQTASPRWTDREILKAAGYDDTALRDAFTGLDGTNDALMSEAAQSIQDIEEGRKPGLNRGANIAFMQKIVDYATNLTLADKARELRIATALYDYATAHEKIVAENERRIRTEAARAEGGRPAGGAAGGTAAGAADAASAIMNAGINAEAPAPTPVVAAPGLAPR